MSNKKMLPIVSTDVKGFSHQATLFSILLAYEKCMPWVCNNFIQLFSIKGLCESERTGTVDFYYSEYNDFKSYEYSANPWIRWYEIPLNILKKETNVVNYIMNNIDLDYYTYLEIDTYYISKYEEYGKTHRIHWIYICGYDKVQSTLSCFDNFSGNNFRLENIKIEEIRNGYLGSYQHYLDNIHLEQEKKNWPGLGVFKVILTAEEESNPDLSEVNLKKIECLMRNYLGEGKENLPYMQSKYYIYGIAIYEELIAFTEKEWGNTKEIDIRAFYAMKDHKSLMIWRIWYIEKYFCVDLEKYREGYISLEKKLNDVILILLKYNITRKKDVLYRAKKILKDCMKIEKRILEEFIQKISMTNENFNKKEGSQ